MENKDAISTNHHPRKLPNRPCNPEVYEPSPGIFKYARKDQFAIENCGTSLALATTLTKSTTSPSNIWSSRQLTGPPRTSFNASPSNEDAIYGINANKVSNDCIGFIDTYPTSQDENEEMSVVLECYDEVTHVGDTTPTPTSPEKSFRPIPTGKSVQIVVTPVEPTPTACEDTIEMQCCIPTDDDDLESMKKKLNVAMQIYKSQRFEISKLNSKMKSITRKNRHLSELKKVRNVGSISKPSVDPFYDHTRRGKLPTNARYILLLKDRIESKDATTASNIELVKSE